MTLKGKGKQVEIAGQMYPSMTVAAKELGVSLSAISHAKRRGRLHSVGVGRGNKIDHLGPIEIGGTSYATITDAAAAWGVSRASMSAFVRVSRLIESGGAE